MAGDVGDDADAELLKGFGYGLVPGVGEVGEAPRVADGHAVAEIVFPDFLEEQIEREKAHRTELMQVQIHFGAVFGGQTQGQLHGAHGIAVPVAGVGPADTGGSRAQGRGNGLFGIGLHVQDAV